MSNLDADVTEKVAHKAARKADNPFNQIIYSHHETKTISIII